MKQRNGIVSISRQLIKVLLELCHIIIILPFLHTLRKMMELDVRNLKITVLRKLNSGLNSRSILD